ncbi:integrase catalytic domain-containing protein [Trichonephila clavipes]|nr:integrase catalytic domain-containing protein [Trichonephila clavipes]
MAPKQSKNIGKFDLIIKELKAFGSRINECDDNKSRIHVLKTQVLQYETRLTEIFSELSTHESDESFDIYMKYKDILFNWVVDLEEKSQVEEVNSSIHVKSSVVNLPKLEVPHFYGNCENWISFKELFKSSILHNKSISDLEKLQYLQASVRGDAAKLIRGFAITVDNLKNCWDILCSRYENKRQLALNQINKLFSIKISRANTSKLLLEIIDICNEVIRNLKTLDLKTNSLTELIIINFLISKVDACISQRWELSLENNKIPTLEEFRVFIEREARGLNELKFVKPDIKKDNASQNSLISKQCADRLKLPLKHTNHKLVGVNETCAETSLYSTNFEFSSCVSSDKFQVKALLVSKVTSAMPNFPIKYHECPHIKGLTLADPTFYIENEIDILLGADVFMTLISGTPIMGPKGTPSALPTKLGHLLSGTINTQYNQNSSLICHTFLNIDHSLKQFWEHESVPKDIPSKDEDELCESIFVNSHIRNTDGRYILKLPFRDDSSIGDSKEGALKRFYSLERKLHSNNQLKEQYTEFMEEYQNLGHMTPLASDVKSPHYFLPHHGVINDNSSTTKLWVVFDGSFKSTNGNSLNDILLTGKKLQSDIFLTLLKFRFFPIAFSADIAKMYRQILISQDDACFQQIFWRKSPEEPLVIFKLNTVTYGTSCAPFLAIRTLKQLCEDEKHRFPQAAKLAKDHFYVDDLLAGADSVDSARKIVHELQNLMSAGRFELRKWSCTHPEVLSGLPNTLKTNISSHSFHEESTQKILGLFWDLNEDSFKVRAVLSDQVSTKRQMLSIIARIFDPLGFVSPSTIILKIILQDLWKAGLDWDDEISPDILNRWNRFQAEISCLKQIKVPRYVQTQNAKHCDIHGFCDASSKAYSAVIYLRVVSDSPHLFLMASKTRVAPVQTISLPKLEICGALLLAELLDIFKKSLNITHDKFLWCDSTITLSWINNPPVKGNQFVQHRVGKIHALTSKVSWHHIPGKLNPADWATKGLYPKQLLENLEWVAGPKWLHDFHSSSNSFIPFSEQPVSLVPIDQSESLSDSAVLSTGVDYSLSFLDKFSSYMKVVRTVAWIFRFYHNSKSVSKVTRPLYTHELETSIKKSEGILRVGGRLRLQQTLKFEQKHPMLIPKEHHFTSLVIRHFHRVNLHAGQELVLSLIRQQFWIPHGKSAVKKELRNCIDCFKLVAKLVSQMMGDLPIERINPCRAFEKVGIDFAGPITTKCQHTRKANNFKSYICLFICMCTKAVHLELVSSLSAAEFLSALRRFVSRRGYPSDIYSDNGTNFVGASAYLKDLFQLLHNSNVQDYSSSKNIQ